MILLLFPTVAILAASLVLTALMIFSYEGSWLPIRAYLHTIIIEYVWFTSEILPIMSIHTLCFVMFLVKWTPFSFEIKHPKVIIFLHVMNQSSFKLFSWMSKRTVVTIFTLANLLWILGTIFRLVLFRVIHRFNSIVG